LELEDSVASNNKKVLYMNFFLLNEAKVLVDSMIDLIVEGCKEKFTEKNMLEQEAREYSLNIPISAKVSSTPYLSQAFEDIITIEKVQERLEKKLSNEIPLTGALYGSKIQTKIVQNEFELDVFLTLPMISRD
jgi:hypothetical protein